MSRHRNIRSMNVEDEYEDEYDSYGRSMEEYDYGVSPGTMAQYTYDRGAKNTFSISNNFPIKEEEEETDEKEEDNRRGSLDEDYVAHDDDEAVLILKASLTDIDLEENFEKNGSRLINLGKLNSCYDAVIGLVDQSTLESDIIKQAIRAQFDPTRTLNYVFENKSPAVSQPQTSSFPVDNAKPLLFKTTTSAEVTPASQAPSKPSKTTSSTANKTLKKPEKYDMKPMKHELEDFGATDASIKNIETQNSCNTPKDSDTPSSSGLNRVSSRSRMLERLDPVKEYEKRRQGGKEFLNLVVIGHVDAGKSTLMGHLLFQLGFVSSKAMHKFEQESKKIGKSSFAYAWVLDETEEERSRGVTMDIAQRRFETASKVFTMIDAPGHRDFIPNMITGAAQADVAILVINSSRGEFETGFELGGQTREHAMLARSLGVSQLLIAVNKMDTVDWSENRFNQIVLKLAPFFKQIGFRDADLTYIPVSGLAGENLTKASTQEKFNWYNGPPLAEQIDRFRPPMRNALDKVLRMSVTDVFKAIGSGISVGGVIYSSNIQAGDKVLVAPANETAIIKNTCIDETTVPVAFAGDNVVVTLTGIDATKLSIGSIVCDLAHPIPQTCLFRARIVIFNINTPITKGFQVVLHYQSLSEQAHIVRLISQLHRTTGEVVKSKPRCLTKNTSAIVDIAVDRALCLETYSNFKELGRFMLRNSGHTVAAGLVIEVLNNSQATNGTSMEAS